MENNFKPGDRVRMLVSNDNKHYVHGEITIVTEDTCKVMFDEDWAPNYWYYPKKDLELIIGEKNESQT